MYDDILLETEERMEKAVDHLLAQFRGIRSGRATPGLVENIRVEYYGSMQPLKAVASIAIPEPRLMVIKPFDGSATKAIERAIVASDIGITPQSDGKLIRLPIPPLSEERRRQLGGLVKEKGEETKVAIRNVRRDSNKLADQGEKDGDLTEDDHAKLKEEIQGLTKQYEEKVEESLKRKTSEIMEI
jgi:ribosome recycling factor